MISEDEAKVHWKFNQCPSVTYANKQLADGMIGSVEHARYILQVWGEFKRLPQYRHIKFSD